MQASDPLDPRAVLGAVKARPGNAGARSNPDAPLFDLPLYYLDRSAKLIVARLGIARWTPHDLRRTAQRFWTVGATRWNRSARCWRIPARA